MGQSNHRMPVDVKKGVGVTASPLIFLSLGDEARDEGWDLTKREPCRKTRISISTTKKGDFSALTQR